MDHNLLTKTDISESTLQYLNKQINRREEMPNDKHKEVVQNYDIPRVKIIVSSRRNSQVRKRETT